jgi:hypothetical protein
MPICRWCLRRRGACSVLQPSTIPVAAFTIDPPVFAPGQKVTFTAQPSPGAHYTWLFGDGTQATGRRVRHRFPDAEGTELDGSKRRGPLPGSAPRRGQGASQDWAAQGVVAVARWHDASPALPPHAARPRLEDLSPENGPSCPT